MIDDALSLIKDELTGFLLLNNGVDNKDVVVLENISDLDKSDSNLDDRVIISLVNIEEESTFKNVKSFRRNEFSGSMEYVHPPVFLNLYILFSCTMPGGKDKYRMALNRLGLVIQFFQSRKVFSLKTALEYKIDNPETLADFELRNFEELKIFMDLYTLTFEQINHLWGSLGGKQVPFAMYKARLVEIKDEQVQRGGSVITEIESKEEIY